MLDFHLLPLPQSIKLRVIVSLNSFMLGPRDKIYTERKEEKDANKTITTPLSQTDYTHPPE